MTTKPAKSIMVGKIEAAKLCGVGKTLWNELVASGRTPEPVRLGRRVLWLREELVEWCENGCPNREKWQAMRQNIG